MNKKGFALRVVVLAVVVILGILGIWYYGSRPAAPAAAPSPSLLVSVSSSPTMVLTPVAPAPTSTSAPAQTPAPISTASTTVPLKTYTDPKDAFSFQYPDGFVVKTTADIYNGNSLAVANGISRELVEVRATSSVGTLIPAAKASLVWINIATSPSSTQAACELPGAGTPTGSSTAVTVAGTAWYEGSQWSYGSSAANMDDEYQTYRNGTCWGVEFSWMESAAQVGAGAPLHSFEVSTLASVKLLPVSVVQ